MAQEGFDDVLQKIDPTKRDFVKALVVGTGFIAPTVASFSMEGISLYEAHAQSNVTEADVGDGDGG
jgi:hypothetical protein